MKILDPSSLIRTVDNLNNALFWNKAWESEVGDLAEWMGSRVGKDSGYAGSYAMTESDWGQEYHLFTGERISTGAGRAHTIAQEATRLMTILERQLGQTLEANRISRDRLTKQIFANEQYYESGTAEYCCATCSVAFWRSLNADVYPEHANDFDNALGTLRENRKPAGGWQRFPFYYTLLVLREKGSEDSSDEITHHLSSCERRLKLTAGKADAYSQRRAELLQRALAA